MGVRSAAAEAVGFALAMLALAAGVFAALYSVIWLGNRLLYLVHDAARAADLPFPVALTLAVFGSAAGVYALYRVLFERR